MQTDNKTARLAMKCANSGFYLEQDAYQAFLDHASVGMRWESFEEYFIEAFEE